MKKRILAIFSLMLVCLLCFSMLSCNAGDDFDVDADNEGGSGGAGAAEGGDAESVVTGAINRKIVYTVELEIETESVGTVYKTLSEKAVALGGYIESDEQLYTDGKSSYCFVTYRVPTEKLNEFLSVAEGSGKLTNKYVLTDDITTKYVSAQARRQSLVDRKTQLEALLNENITVSEKVNLIEQISSVNSQIMQIDLMLAGYDSDVDFSTVTVEIGDEGVNPGVVLLILLGGIVVIGGGVAVIMVIFSAKKRKSVNF
jgi:hypothetical protein